MAGRKECAEVEVRSGEKRNEGLISESAELKMMRVMRCSLSVSTVIGTRPQKEFRDVLMLLVSNVLQRSGLSHFSLGDSAFVC